MSSMMLEEAGKPEENPHVQVNGYDTLSHTATVDYRDPTRMSFLVHLSMTFEEPSQARVHLSCLQFQMCLDITMYKE